MVGFLNFIFDWQAKFDGTKMWNILMLSFSKNYKFLWQRCFFNSFLGGWGERSRTEFLLNVYYMELIKT